MTALLKTDVGKHVVVAILFVFHDCSGLLLIELVDVKVSCRDGLGNPQLIFPRLTRKGKA